MVPAISEAFAVCGAQPAKAQKTKRKGRSKKPDESTADSVPTDPAAAALKTALNSTAGLRKVWNFAYHFGMWLMLLLPHAFRQFTKVAAPKAGSTKKGKGKAKGRKGKTRGKGNNGKLSGLHHEIAATTADVESLMSKVVKKAKQISSALNLSKTETDAQSDVVRELAQHIQPTASATNATEDSTATAPFSEKSKSALVYTFDGIRQCLSRLAGHASKIGSDLKGLKFK